MIKRLPHLLCVFCVLLVVPSAYSKGERHWVIDEYVQHLEAIRKSWDSRKLEEARDAIRGMASLDAYEAIVERFENLPKNPQKMEHPFIIEILGLLTDILMEVGSEKDTKLIARVDAWLAEQSVESVVKEMMRKTHSHLALLTEPREPLSSLESINQILLDAEINDSRLQKDAEPKKLTARPEAYQKSHRRGLNQVEEFYNYLNERVVGQEEILRALEALYLKDVMSNGHRVKPEVFYFLGLPGNGKDTIVESYVDALNNKEGAYETKMFRMNIRTKEEAWSYFGSGKGYVGSGELPEFLRFLVENSGGKYRLGKQQDGLNERLVVEKNPAWKPESVGIANGPHKIVVFINEAHNIPKDVKDNVLKQAIERGIFPITNPGEGPMAANHIKLNVTFIFASNEGIDLLEPRQKNGARIGKPFSYERLYENWQRVHMDKPELKQAILKNNGEINDAVRGGNPGTSEEFLNRIPDQRLFILKPLSPDEVFRVAKIEATNQSNIMSSSRGPLGRYRVTLTDELIRAIAEHNYIPSENARPIKGRLEGYVFEEIYRAIKREKIRPLGTEQELVIDVKDYGNGAKSLVFQVTDTLTGNKYGFTRLMEATLKDVPKSPLPQERVDEILEMRERILSNVFGVEHIVDRLIEAAIVSESEARNSGENTRPATVMAFLGLTSTGKTETAKQYVRARYGESEKVNVIDFNGVRTIEAMEAKILGSYDYAKNPIASEFMKAYDRAPEGNLAFIFDEAANSPKELLKALFEILREPIANGFTDGKPRSMKNVTIILTGNAGEQIYQNIPRGLPAEIHERAQHEVFRLFVENESLKQKILTETFPDAMIARLGRNIYHFGPLNNSGKRQVAQLKLLKGIENLKPKKSERGWNIKFASESDLLRTFDMIETEGFHLAYQGASIDKFVREQIIDRIKAMLLKSGVANKSDVVVELLEESREEFEKNNTKRWRQLRLSAENGRQLTVEIPVESSNDMLTKTPLDRSLVGYHEVGHEIVSEVFLGDRVRPAYLSIINGVTEIDGALIPYNGVRAGNALADITVTKEALLRRVAGLTGGYMAQQVVTLGGRHDSGKSDDMRRATLMIQEAILRYGLSERWGKRAIAKDVKTEDFIAKVLTEEERRELNDLTKEWLREAESMARMAIFLNLDGLFYHMSQELIEKGYIDKADIARIYESNPVVTEHDTWDYEKRSQEIAEVMEIIDRGLEKAGEAFTRRFGSDIYDYQIAEQAFQFLFKKSQGLKGMFKSNPWQQFSANQKLVASAYIGMKIPDNRRDARYSSDYWVVENVADVSKFIAEERVREASQVTKVESFDLFEAAPKGSGALMCGKLFAQ